MGGGITTAMARCVLNILLTLCILPWSTGVVHSRTESGQTLTVQPPGLDVTGHGSNRVRLTSMNTHIVRNRKKSGNVNRDVFQGLRIRRALTEQDEETVITRLNQFRRSVQASNMQYVSWDSQLESFVRIWSRLCDAGATVSKSSYTVQSLVGIYDSSNFTLGTAADTVFRSPYYQFLLANLHAIGCGMRVCPTFKDETGIVQNNVTLFACILGFLEPIYSIKVGDACSECPPLYQLCDNDLCTNSSLKRSSVPVVSLNTTAIQQTTTLKSTKQTLPQKTSLSHTTWSTLNNPDEPALKTFSSYVIGGIIGGVMFLIVVAVVIVHFIVYTRTLRLRAQRESTQSNIFVVPSAYPSSLHLVPERPPAYNSYYPGPPPYSECLEPSSVEASAPSYSSLYDNRPPSLVLPLYKDAVFATGVNASSTPVEPHPPAEILPNDFSHPSVVAPPYVTTPVITVNDVIVNDVTVNDVIVNDFTVRDVINNDVIVNDFIGNNVQVDTTQAYANQAFE